MAALGSFLDARARHGQWLVRIEDLDPPRERPGAADEILRSLETLGLHWDGPVLRQSTRTDAYAAALDELHGLGLTRPCTCSRSALAALAQNRDRPAGEELYHPPECVPGGRDATPGQAIRFRAPDSEVEFTDRLQGRIRCNVALTGGDFVLRRRDGLFAYQLAVVVDDAEQGVTDVVRGADLLGSTPRQVLLQDALRLPRPGYLHLPLAVDDRGLKLSKSENAPAAGRSTPSGLLATVLEFLGQEPPAGLERAGRDDVLRWGVLHWDPGRCAGIRARRVDGTTVHLETQEQTR